MKPRVRHHFSRSTVLVSRSIRCQGGRLAQVVLVEATDAFTHVAVRGDLDEVGVGEFDLRLPMSRRKPAIVDLSRVGLITSLGIGTLVAVVKSMRQLGLGIVFIIGPSHARKVLEATAIGTLVPLVATREEALSTLGLPDSSLS